MVLNCLHFSHVLRILNLIFVIVLVHEFDWHVYASFLLLVIFESCMFFLYNIDFIWFKFWPDISQMHLILLLFIRNSQFILLFVFILLIFYSLHSNILNVILFVHIIRKVIFYLIAAEDFGALLLHIWRIVIRLLNNEFLEQLVTGSLLGFPSQRIFVIFLHNLLHVKNRAIQTDVIFILKSGILHKLMGCISYGLRIWA